jgi:hypothetical protein
MRPIPILASKFCCVSSKELGVSERPLSVKLSVKRLVETLLARTRQNCAETRHYLLTQAGRTGARFITKKVMNQRYIKFKRAGVFYCEDTTTGKQTSLRTKDETEADILLHTRNEAQRQPVLNLQIARVYLKHSDPEVAKRTK